MSHKSQIKVNVHALIADFDESKFGKDEIISWEAMTNILADSMAIYNAACAYIDPIKSVQYYAAHITVPTQPSEVCSTPNPARHTSNP